MIVDDSLFMRRCIKKIIHSLCKATIIEARSGEEAIVKFMLHHPTLVTMDITLPQINGIETTKRLLAKDPGVKIIMCSSMSQKILIEEALEAGAIDFITKPFKEKKVKKILEPYL